MESLLHSANVKPNRLSAGTRSSAREYFWREGVQILKEVSIGRQYETKEKQSAILMILWTIVALQITQF